MRNLHFFDILALLLTVTLITAAPTYNERAQASASASSSRITSSTTSTRSISSAVKDINNAALTSSSNKPLTSISTTTAVTSKLDLKSTFIYELDHVPVASPEIVTKTGLKINAGVYIVDMVGTTKEQIAKYKADGKTVVCYFSAGTWEPGRPDALTFDPACVCASGSKLTSTKCSSKKNKMSDWDEWWLDIHSASCKTSVKNIMAARIKAAADKGCDGVDPDNVDSYANTQEQKYGNTAQDQVDYLLWLSQTARSNGLLVDLKNTGGLLVDDSTGNPTQWQSSLIQAFDFSVIEQCHRYKECDTYDAFLAAGKPELHIEYGKVKTCPTLKAGQHMLVYSGTTLDTSKITLSC